MKKGLFAGLALLLLVGAALHGVRSAAIPASADAEAVRLPILMYHSVLKDPSRAGDYTVTPAQLENDLTYLKDHGFETVTVQDLIAHVDGRESLPARPVMVTFDDGHYNNLTYALPILERLDMCAVVSVVGAFADQFTENRDPNPNYAYLAWDEIEAAAASGRIEIQNHSYDMHSLLDRCGSARKKGESEQAYAKVFLEDTEKMQRLLSERSGVTATAYAYPYGSTCSEADALLHSLGFRASFTCTERVNTVVRGDAESLFNLGRFNRAAGETTAVFMRRILDGTEAHF